MIVASAKKKSFSKLKLLKNYSISSISQEILNDLVILCIEINMIEYINVNTIIMTLLHQEMLLEIILYGYLDINKIDTTIY
jgi:hypothetical protein